MKLKRKVSKAHIAGLATEFLAYMRGGNTNMAEMFLKHLNIAYNRYRKQEKA